ncbi:unnamed protein product [Adineta ricciae]|uniref:Transposase n=1 Tax=Adineta ricciae TaxID=249248 RepID=A0A816C7L8_ADIRI|nr:unnamed protein product [Adineta ricciae]
MQNDEIYPSQKFQRYPKYWGEYQQDILVKSTILPLFTVDEIKRQRPSYGTRGIKIHHDNGKPHIHEQTCIYLRSERLTVIPHPANSPDLSPCGFWLFDFIKDNLTDYNDSQSLHDAIVNFM